MTPNRPCPRCGAPLPAGGMLAGLCPACLLRQEAAAGIPAAEARDPAAPAYPELAEVRRDFPQLEIVRPIGRGGMGVVYEARQPRLDRGVALKVLAPEVAGDPLFDERFLREARALARLRHPNVVAVHDFGEQHGRYYLLMELVEGTSLRRLLETGAIDAARALELVPEICAGLQYAHEQGVVHRDVKPENVLVDRDGRVRLVDFGLVKLAGADEGDARLTRVSQVMGTPRYMAPEQLQRPREVDHRADVYALGVLLYEMLTGELPAASPAAPSSWPGVDPRLDDVVARALEPDPARRFSNAGELGAQVAAIAAEPARPAADAGRPRSDRSESEGWPRGRRVPFHNEDKWGGLVVLYGLVGWEDDVLVLEYRTRDCLELHHSESRELRIPLANLGATTFKRGWFGRGVLRLIGTKLQSFGEFPEEKAGQIRLTIDRAATLEAQRLCSFVQGRIDRRDG